MILTWQMAHADVRLAFYREQWIGYIVDEQVMPSDTWDAYLREGDGVFHRVGSASTPLEAQRILEEHFIKEGEADA